MIYLRTGLPGSGKTLRTITMALAEVAKGREVYALNVNGLNYAATGIKEWTKGLEDWQTLPTGALLIVDEVQSYLKPRGPAATPPDWIEAMTRNRHSGIDLAFVTQDPMLMDPYVRRLVNYHEHLVRMDGGFNRARIFSAEYCMDVGKGKVPDGAEFALWAYPEQNFALYQSAAAHTVRKRVPQSLKFVAVGSLIVAGCIWAAFAVLGGIGTDEPATRTASETPRTKPGQGLAQLGGTLGQRRPMTVEEYITHITPRIPGHPWSAPMYDGQKPTTQPRIACISTASTCRCYTEQATPVKTVEPVCRTLARDGAYNPFLQVQPQRIAAAPATPAEPQKSAQESSAETAPHIGEHYRPPGLERGPIDGNTEPPSVTP